MDANQLIEFQLKQCGSQLRKVLEDWPVLAADANVETAMSARESVNHLTECYEAVLKKAKGEAHEWGTFQMDTSNFGAAVAKMFDHRAKAISMLGGMSDGLETATMFIVMHDPYHVGQLCTLRAKVQPDWNPYSIYED
ncbi:MAG: hypothetical protein JSS72_09305 [Armatimonadetes bacterium]|nr:hypothetical protein [Armatimonadota bacterium]